MVRLFKFLLTGVTLLLLLAGALVLWLRYEIARVEQSPSPLASWDKVAVAALPGAPPEITDCDNKYPLRRALFGALHVHTSASYDARSFGAQATVDDAYRFARGGVATLSLADDPPDFTAPQVQISAPLDFMAVTDHAEMLGERSLCLDPSDPAFDVLVCELYRGEIALPVDHKLQALMRLASMAIFGSDRSVRICGDDGMRCRERAETLWEESQRTTDAWQDRSGDCVFTTLHAYEYTLAEQAANLHRNVIFRTSTVPQEALSAKDARTPEALWAWLQERCIDGDPDCDVLAIPHNSNWSSGRMFHPYSNRDVPLAEQRRLAALRAELEPLAEIMQVKGDSECRNGLSSVYGAPDEFCDFEKLRAPAETIEDCGETEGAGGMMLTGCLSRYNYVRYALTAGLAEETRLGINPFKLGIVAASDTHNAAPAVGREKGHQGSHGTDRLARDRLIDSIDVPGGIAKGSPVRYNPGGIAGIYAEQNTRGALFEAMRRRETFGTSGPRIAPRFFAGWNLPRDICQSPHYLAEAYRDGVPMGLDLPAGNTDATAPVFVASATADSRDGGNLLQRIQVIKGWVDAQGRTHQAVFDVAGDGPGNASVDEATCEVSGTGHRQLCATWRDPEFDPAVSAVYYARVLENPSCRWSHHDCLSLPAAERPASCSAQDPPWQIQERAWTSPIWYRSAASGGAAHD
ncbi:MAG: DUF3604 domain-containing protein [Halioglobus sp.]|nr:DUF3604 domain-containing protein [Halioglobus sp.]